MAFCEEIAAIMVDVQSQRSRSTADLKPENDFLCPRRDPALPLGYRVKLLDFGIAKLPPAPGRARSPPLEVHTQESPSWARPPI